MQCGRCESENTKKNGWQANCSGTGRVQRYYCHDCGYRGMSPLFQVTDSHHGDIQKRPRYVITAAQDASPAHLGFLESLLAYCGHHDAQLIVIPFRYRNPTSNKEDQENTWDSKLEPYMIGEQRQIVPGLQLMAHIKTQPTAVNPLSGLDTITGKDCGIFGHTRLALESVPTPGQQLPKLLMTTGAVTKPNYSDSKAGRKGEFHHTLAAVVVELDGDVFHLRHINAQADGTFIDLDKKYTRKGVKAAGRPAGLILGDIHAQMADKDNMDAVNGKRGIIDTLRPRRLVLHDVLDFGSQSHHNTRFDRLLKNHMGADVVADELRETCKVIDALARRGQETVVVASNHHDHLGKWLQDDRVLRTDHIDNALLWHSLNAKVIKHIKVHGEVADPFKLATKELLKSKPRFLERTEHYSIHDIELAFHGDKGPNGARGNAKAFNRIGPKTVIGHSHTPRIVGGCFQTGTSSVLNMDYVEGPSSWLHSHVLIYPNGKRTHIHVVQGRWRSEPKRRKAK